MTIREWLRSTGAEFADALLPSAGLDAEVILSHTLNKPRTWLHAHDQDELDPRRKDIADARAKLRLERVPVAYIVGHKEFYGRRFFVTPDVLIPRPESEALLQLLEAHLPSDAKHLIDVGTGSGCLGITAKLEHSELSVTLADISKNALKIAEKNSIALKANVRTLLSDLLSDYPIRPDVIIANLPYVDRSWAEQSPELRSEPALALYAEDNGLSLIKELLIQAASRLNLSGLVLLEADPRQHEAIIGLADTHGYQLLETTGFAIALASR